MTAICRICKILAETCIREELSVSSFVQQSDVLLRCHKLVAAACCARMICLALCFAAENDDYRARLVRKQNGNAVWLQPELVVVDLQQ
jgi:hypothetical protein